MSFVAWLRNALGLKPGELGDCYVAIWLVGQVIGLSVAAIILLLK